MNSKASSRASAWELPRSMATARVLTQLGLEHGVSIDTLLAHTGIERCALDDPKAQIEATQEIQLIRNLVRELPHVPTLGLIAGSRYRVSTYGFWGYAVISSQTWGGALDMASRMMNNTYALTSLALNRAGQTIVSQFEVDHLPVDIRQFVLDRDRACAVALQREIVGCPLPYTEIRMRRAEPRAELLLAYTELFGVKPLFGQSQDSGVFDAAILNQPLPRPNHLTVNACEQMCRQLVEARYTRTGVAAQVRDRLLKTPGHIPDMEEIASEMHMTSRTLRRHLTAEGATFRSLLEEVRSTLAEELMATAKLTHGEIAQRLGYADVTTFIEAFRRWKGVAPSEYRRSQGLPAHARRGPRRLMSVT